MFWRCCLRNGPGERASREMLLLRKQMEQQNPGASSHQLPAYLLWSFLPAKEILQSEKGDKSLKSVL